MSAITSKFPVSIQLATEAQCLEISTVMVNAFWSKYKVFLDETNPESKSTTCEEFIRLMIFSKENELYLLVNEVNSTIIGTILLRTKYEDNPNEASFGLLAKDPKFSNSGVKIGNLLMTHAIKRVEELGKNCLKMLVMNVDDHENKLVKYFEERGFKKTGKTFDFPRKHCLKQNYKDKICLIEMQHVII